MKAKLFCSYPLFLFSVLLASLLPRTPSPLSAFAGFYIFTCYDDLRTDYSKTNKTSNHFLFCSGICNLPDGPDETYGREPSPRQLFCVGTPTQVSNNPNSLREIKLNEASNPCNVYV